MNIPPVYKSEYQLCLLVWEYEPIRKHRTCKAMPANSALVKVYHIYSYS